ncbi:MAG: PPC domain-containing DNA-binding protein [Candidatus Heimdallarchaeaceae archaeon]|jgi:predicted DNA-binding protein with PD1-like motif
MKSVSGSIKKIHFLKLEKGEDILSSIIEYCKNNELKSGVLVGLGAVEKAKLGFFDMQTKTYLTNNYDFNAEIVNCTGNIAINGETGEYIAHIHMIIGDKEGNTFGGHVLPDNPISVTGEFKIIETDVTLQRRTDSDFNLLLLDL